MSKQTENQMIEERVAGVRGYTHVDVTDLVEGGVLDAYVIDQHGDKRITFWMLPSVADGVIHIELFGFVDGVRVKDACFTVWGTD